MKDKLFSAILYMKMGEKLSSIALWLWKFISIQYWYSCRYIGTFPIIGKIIDIDLRELSATFSILKMTGKLSKKTTDIKKLLISINRWLLAAYHISEIPKQNQTKFHRSSIHTNCPKKKEEKKCLPNFYAHYWTFLTL